MAKKDMRENGRITRSATQRFCLDLIATQIIQDMKKPLSKKMGIRYKVIEVYHSKGILEAYKVLVEYNKRFDEPVYTRERFEEWIREEDKRNKGQVKSNEFDR